MTSSCQSSDSGSADPSVSHSLRILGRPCMYALAGAALLSSSSLYCTTGYSCPAASTGLRPVSATHLAGAGLPTPAPAQRRDGTSRGSSLGLDRRCRVQQTPNQSHAPKSLQLRLPHFITDTHTHSLPFTWVLLMDLGLGSADNINGSRLTEVPL